MSHAVSVVIPMFNEARHILRTLEAVRTAAQAAGCAWEVIVVDNGSSDQGPELARDWGAQVLDCPGLNIAALRNRGAAVARHDWLAFLDADMQVPEQWLVTWRQVRQADRAEMLGLVHRPPAQAPWYARAWLHKVAAEREREGLVDWLPTANLCVERHWFERVGGFDERLRTGEDKDFSLRLKRAGARLLSLPTPPVLNWGYETSWREWLGKELWRQNSQVQLLRASRLSPRLLRFPLLAAGHWGISGLALLCLLLGQPTLALVLFLAGWLPAVLLTLRHRYNRRRPILALRLLLLHWLRMHVAGLALFLGFMDLTARRPSRG
ncbi:MAG TPA: glycosyltransferase [Pseudomonas sp.]|nr:glycosyltransferase [Pseudomonas sp.]